MLELGEREVEFHFEAGKQASEWKWDLLIAVGPLGRHMVEGALSGGMTKDHVFHFENSEAAGEKIWSFVREGDLVLVKGSRGIEMDKVVERLREE